MSEELHGDHRKGPGDMETKRFWEDFYRRRERVWSGRANPVLVDVAGALPPGTALDLGCGEGDDAIWLARRGWRVTAVDVSATALQRAGDHAVTAGVADRIDFQRHDLARTFPAGAFDLVSAQYLHSPVEFPRDRVLRAAASAVAPGGLLLIVGHGSVGPRASNPDAHHLFPTPEEVLSSWTCPPVGGTPRGSAPPPSGRTTARTARPSPSSTTSSRSDACPREQPSGRRSPAGRPPAEPTHRDAAPRR